MTHHREIIKQNEQNHRTIMGQCMIKAIHTDESIHCLDSTAVKPKETTKNNGTSKSNRSIDLIVNDSLRSGTS